MRSIDTIIIHCSDSPPGRGDDASTIHDWHTKRGFDGIGYHAVILENGKIEVGRPDYWVGAHAIGHNGTSLGVCIIGKGFYTQAQMFALFDYIRDKKFQYPEIVNDNIFGHCDVSSKKCPRFDVEKFKKDYLDA